MNFFLIKLFIIGRNHRLILFVCGIIILTFIYYSEQTLISSLVYVEIRNLVVSQRNLLSPHVNIIDLQKESRENFSCIKTKRLLNITQTTICLHDIRDAVSRQIAEEKVWEEKLLTRLLIVLQRYPQMNFFDVGANIGSYTLFVASLGRQVISIECFKPNIDRIRKAIQIEHVEKNVILIGNAIHEETGRYFKMTSDPENVGSQAVLPKTIVKQTEYDDIYVVKTIQFDEILPILKIRNIRQAIMKVDIQWAEIYLCQTGNKTFNYVNIPVILMEWDLGSRLFDRFDSLSKCFFNRGYFATSDLCRVLPNSEALKTWPADIYWMKVNLT
ncbi:unnamed protein product, partial [Adineta ricciae]